MMLPYYRDSLVLATTWWIPSLVWSSVILLTVSAERRETVATRCGMWIQFFMLCVSSILQAVHYRKYVNLIVSAAS
jgi:hypothetical protein